MDQPIPIPGEIQAEIPKPELEEPKNKANVWLRTIVSLALFLVLGYYFFGKGWAWVIALTAVVVFHEMGHFLANHSEGAHRGDDRRWRRGEAGF